MVACSGGRPEYCTGGLFLLRQFACETQKFSRGSFCWSKAANFLLWLQLRRKLSFSSYAKQQLMTLGAAFSFFSVVAWQRSTAAQAGNWVRVNATLGEAVAGIVANLEEIKKKRGIRF